MRELKRDVQVFALIMEDTDKKEEIKMGSTDFFRGLGLHYQFAEKAVDEGLLLLGGPCDVGGKPKIGIFVLKAPSLEAAQKFADSEPFHKMG
jgi:uncharacterized protein YciI